MHLLLKMRTRLLYQVYSSQGNPGPLQRKSKTATHNCTTLQESPWTPQLLKKTTTSMCQVHLQHHRSPCLRMRSSQQDHQHHNRDIMTTLDIVRKSQSLHLHGDQQQGLMLAEFFTEWWMTIKEKQQSWQWMTRSGQVLCSKVTASNIWLNNYMQRQGLTMTLFCVHVIPWVQSCTLCNWSSPQTSHLCML